MNTSNVIFAIGLVLTVMGLMGVAFAVFKSSGVQKTIDILESENAALTASVARQRTDFAMLQERVLTIEGENKVLRNIATGKQAVDELTTWAKSSKEQDRAEHLEMIKILSTCMGSLTDLKEAVEEIWKGIIRWDGNDRRKGA